jgi:CMP-2-keto-3-deoxyoctulosonic acid synthetase
MLENGFKIKIVITEYESIAVDTQEDLERARKYYNKYVKKNEKTG